jgi:hypothetical protein
MIVCKYFLWPSALLASFFVSSVARSDVILVVDTTPSLAGGGELVAVSAVDTSPDDVVTTSQNIQSGANFTEDLHFQVETASGTSPNFALRLKYVDPGQSQQPHSFDIVNMLITGSSSSSVDILYPSVGDSGTGLTHLVIGININAVPGFISMDANIVAEGTPSTLVPTADPNMAPEPGSLTLAAAAGAVLAARFGWRRLSPRKRPRADKPGEPA